MCLVLCTNDVIYFVLTHASAIFSLHTNYLNVDVIVGPIVTIAHSPDLNQKQIVSAH